MKAPLMCKVITKQYFLLASIEAFGWSTIGAWPIDVPTFPKKFVMQSTHWIRKHCGFRFIA